MKTQTQDIIHSQLCWLVTKSGSRAAVAITTHCFISELQWPGAAEQRKYSLRASGTRRGHPLPVDLRPCTPEPEQGLCQSALPGIDLRTLPTLPIPVRGNTNKMQAYANCYQTNQFPEKKICSVFPHWDDFVANLYLQVRFSTPPWSTFHRQAELSHMCQASIRWTPNSMGSKLWNFSQKSKNCAIFIKMV